MFPVGLDFFVTFQERDLRKLQFAQVSFKYVLPISFDVAAYLSVGRYHQYQC